MLPSQRGEKRKETQKRENEGEEFDLLNERIEKTQRKSSLQLQTSTTTSSSLSSSMSVKTPSSNLYFNPHYSHHHRHHQLEQSGTLGDNSQSSHSTRTSNLSSYSLDSNQFVSPIIPFSRRNSSSIGANISINDQTIHQDSFEAGPSRMYENQYKRSASYSISPINKEADDEFERAQEAPAPSFDPFMLMDRTKEPRTYTLVIRQSPKHGQMCTLGSKERRILDPLPIIQLEIRDRNGNRDLEGESSPLLVMQVGLIVDQIDFGSSGNYISSISTNADPIILSPPSTTSSSNALQVELTDPFSQSFKTSPSRPFPHQFPALRLLEGKLTASPHLVRDVEHMLDDKEGLGEEEEVENDGRKSCFFIFTDLSIRLRGMYKLEFSLIKLGQPLFAGGHQQDLSQSSQGKIVANIISEPFPIYHSKDFKGMLESTILAKSLANQGVHIPIRNETKRRIQNKQQEDNSNAILQTQQESTPNPHIASETSHSSSSVTPIAPSHSSETPENVLRRSNS